MEVFRPEYMDWEIYREQLEWYFDEEGIEEENEKKYVILSEGGAELLNLIQILLESRLAAANYTEIIETLNNHFNLATDSKQNVILERYNFHQRFQKPTETLVDYVEALKKLCEKCNYKDVDDMIRDQVLCGMNDDAMRKKFLAKPTLKLQDIVCEVSGAKRKENLLMKPAATARTQQITTYSAVPQNSVGRAHQSETCFKVPVSPANKTQQSAVSFKLPVSATGQMQGSKPIATSSNLPLHTNKHNVVAEGKSTISNTNSAKVGITANEIVTARLKLQQKYEEDAEVYRQKMLLKEQKRKEEWLKKQSRFSNPGYKLGSTDEDPI